MNPSIATIAGSLGIAVSLLTLSSVIWKASSAIAELRRSQERLESALRSEVAELQHELDKQALMINGYRERVEHVNLRLTGNTEKLTVRLTDVENFLQKTTSFETRSNR